MQYKCYDCNKAVIYAQLKQIIHVSYPLVGKRGRAVICILLQTCIVQYVYRDHVPQVRIKGFKLFLGHQMNIAECMKTKEAVWINIH